MTLSELLSRVRSMLAEPSTSVNQFWTDDELKMWINEGYKQFCIDTKCLRRSSYHTFSANESEVALPSSTLKIYSVYLDTGSRKYLLRPITYREILENYDDTSTSTRPTTYYVREGNIIGVYPIPSEEITLYITYAYEPYDLTNDTDEPEIPERYQPAICYYACHQALLKNQDTSARAPAYFTNYQMYVVKALRELSTLTPGVNIRPYNYREEFRFDGW